MTVARKEFEFLFPFEGIKESGLTQNNWVV
jgi:hypothetical protein